MVKIDLNHNNYISTSYFFIKYKNLESSNHKHKKKDIPKITRITYFRKHKKGLTCVNENFEHCLEEFIDSEDIIKTLKNIYLR